MISLLGVVILSFRRVGRWACAASPVAQARLRGYLSFGLIVIIGMFMDVYVVGQIVDLIPVVTFHALLRNLVHPLRIRTMVWSRCRRAFLPNEGDEIIFALSLGIYATLDFEFQSIDVLLADLAILYESPGKTGLKAVVRVCEFSSVWTFEHMSILGLRSALRWGWGRVLMSRAAGDAQEACHDDAENQKHISNTSNGMSQHPEPITHTHTNALASLSSFSSLKTLFYLVPRRRRLVDVTIALFLASPHDANPCH